MKQNWPYLAGLFDGEGCIHISRTVCRLGIENRKMPEYRLVVQITNTDIGLMKWLIKNAGGRFRELIYKNPKPNWRPCYVWMPSGKKNKEKFLLGILPYLVVKREQTLLGLEFDRIEGLRNYGTDPLISIKNSETKQIMYEKMRALKQHKGTVETNTTDTSTEVKIESELHSDM